jgi:hypothetical protein
MARTFRGYTLDDTNGLSLGVALRDGLSIGGEATNKLGDGLARARTSRGGRLVRLDFNVRGDTSALLHSNLRDLLKRLYDPSEGDLILDTYRLRGCVPRPGEVDYAGPVDASLMATVSCVFESRNSFWELATPLIGSDTLTNNLVSEESATMTYGADYAPVRPAFEITSNKVGVVNYTVTLRNDDTGEELRLVDFDLDQNDVLTIDAWNEQVKITNTSGNATPPRRVDGHFWEIEGASITLITKHNQIGLSPNFTVGWELPAAVYGWGA